MNVLLPEPVGVPLINPDELRDKPVGSAPALIDHTRGGVQLTAVSWMGVYAVPTIPLGGVGGTIKQTPRGGGPSCPLPEIDPAPDHVPWAWTQLVVRQIMNMGIKRRISKCG